MPLADNFFLTVLVLYYSPKLEQLIAWPERPSAPTCAAQPGFGLCVVGTLSEDPRRFLVCSFCDIGILIIVFSLTFQFFVFHNLRIESNDVFDMQLDIKLPT
ncbi:hypothetical protein BD770DRAFT_409213 [Pilaira anomala]|nr:hypothetical protein BD770DRAFT_409213 [Pilaira anomala]